MDLGLPIEQEENVERGPVEVEEEDAWEDAQEELGEVCRAEDGEKDAELPGE